MGCAPFTSTGTSSPLETDMDTQTYIEQFKAAREDEDQVAWIDELRVQLSQEEPQTILDVCGPLFDEDTKFWHRRLGWLLVSAFAA